MNKGIRLDQKPAVGMFAGQAFEIAFFGAVKFEHLAYFFERQVETALAQRADFLPDFWQQSFFGQRKAVVNGQSHVILSRLFGVDGSGKFLNTFLQFHGLLKDVADHDFLNRAGFPIAVFQFGE